jgi:type III secretion protein S
VTPNEAISQLTEAMIIVMLLSMPPILIATVVGLVVSVLQALTQVQEQTLPFAVKLIAVTLTIAAMSGLLGSEMLAFTVKIFNNFPKYV